MLVVVGLNGYHFSIHLAALHIGIAHVRLFPCTKIRMLSSLPVVGKVKAMVGEDAPVDAATLYVPGVIGDIVKMSEAALYVKH